MILGPTCTYLISIICRKQIFHKSFLNGQDIIKVNNLEICHETNSNQLSNVLGKFITGIFFIL